MTPAAQLHILVSAQTTQASAALTKINAQLGTTAATGNKASAKMKKVTKHFGLVGAAAAAAGAKLTVDFDKSMRNVNSIAQLNERQFQKLQKSVLNLAGPTAQAPKALADGMYDLVSSGFSANESLKILAASARAATAGLTTTEVATDAVSTVLNAYSLPASKAAHVSDVLFRTVDKGKITFEQLSSSIGDALPFATDLGVSLEEVGAGFASLTIKGISAEETATRIKGALVALVKPSVDMKKAFDALGVATGEQLIRKYGSLQGALEALRKTTGGNKEAFQRMFPDIRGASAALSLTGRNAEGARKHLEALRDSSGSTSKALSQQSKSVSYQWEQMKSEVKAALVDIGTTAIPVFARLVRLVLGFRENAIKAVRAVGRFWTDVWTRPKKAFGDLLAAVLRGFAKLFDAASHLPGVGGKFKDLAASARRSAAQVDRLGEEIKGVKSKKVKVDVDVYAAFKASGDRDRAIYSLPTGDPPRIGAAIDAYTKTKASEWAKANAASFLAPVGPLGMFGGAVSGTLGKANRLAQRFGLRITSGYRTPAQNAAAGGVANSLHTHGSPGNPGAIDLVGSGGAMAQALAYARSHWPLNEAMIHDAGSGLHLHLGFFAKGGKALKQQMAVVGEKGPELVSLPAGSEVFSHSRSKAMVATAAAMGAPGFASGGTVARAAYAAGFRGSWLRRMVAEAKGESGWNERAVGDGGNSIGLWQIHLPSHPWARRLRLRDPFVNAKAAMRIFRSQGVGAWHANHYPHMGAAAAAIRSMGRGRGRVKKPRRILTDAPVVGNRGTVMGGGGGGGGESFSSLTGLFGSRPSRPIGNTSIGKPGFERDPSELTDQNQALIDALQAAAEAARFQAEQLAALRAESKEQAARQEYLVTRQGPQLVAALTMALSGKMGRTAALGRRTPAAPGRVAAL